MSIQTLKRHFKKNPQKMRVQELNILLKSKKVKNLRGLNKSEKISLLNEAYKLKKDLADDLQYLNIQKGKTKKGNVNKVKKYLSNNENVLSGIIEKKLQKWGVWERKRYFSTGKNETLKDLYNDIKRVSDKLISENKHLTNIVVYFQPVNSRRLGEVAFTSLSPAEIFTYDDFKERIEDQQAGRVEGSDEYAEDEFNVLLNVFDILTGVFIGHSKNYKSVFYNVENDIIFNKKFEKMQEDYLKDNDKEIFDEVFKNGYCAFECLNKINNIDLSEFIEKKLYDLNEMIVYINNNNLKVAIVGDIIKFVEGFNVMKKKSSEFERIKINGRLKMLYKLKEKDFKKVFYYKPESTEYIILYDFHKKHFSLLNPPFKIKENIYICDKHDMYFKNENNFKKFDTVHNYYKKLIDYNVIGKASYNTRYLFIDYEGVIDFEFENITIPYSVAWLDLNFEELEALRKADDKTDKRKIKNIIKRNGFFKLGFDCTRTLYNYIIDKENVRYKIITFNGVNYDNFILYNDLSKIAPESINPPFYQGTRLLNFKINGVHDLFDLRKHLTGSLKNNCEGFEVKICNKKAFDHNEAQILYNKKILIETLKKDNKLKEYNLYDVLSLALLYQKYTSTIGEISSDFRKVNIREKMTIGGYMLNVISNHWKKSNIHISNFHVKYNSKGEDENKKNRYLKYYKDLKKSNSAGRVQLFNGMQKIEDDVLSLDVCSLYPFVMAVLSVYYPTGDLIETKKYKNDKIGFYYCDVDQSILKKNKKPLILCEKTKTGNNWATNNILKDVLISTVKIGYLKYHGAKVKIKNGFYYETQIKSCDLFKPLLEIMKIKNNEDIKKNSGEKFNSALRQVVKLMSNCVSGKMIEGLHIEQLIELTTSQYLEFKKNNENHKVLKLLKNGKLFISYKKDELKCTLGSAPVHIGILIYDYSQFYMYETQFLNNPYNKLIYTDTDSNKLRRKDFNKWVESVKNSNVPHWPEVEKYDDRYRTHKLYNANSKVYGSYENEYDFITTNNYFTAKKCYLSYGINKNNEPKYKMSFNGVSNKDVIIYNDNSGDYIKVENKKIYLEGLRESEMNDLYNKSVKISACVKELFETLYNNKKIKILTQCFKRNIKTGALCNTISVYTRIKNIKL